MEKINKYNLEKAIKVKVRIKETDQNGFSGYIEGKEDTVILGNDLSEMKGGFIELLKLDGEKDYALECTLTLLNKHPGGVNMAKSYSWLIGYL